MNSDSGKIKKFNEGLSPNSHKLQLESTLKVQWKQKQEKRRKGREPNTLI